MKQFLLPYLSKETYEINYLPEIARLLISIATIAVFGLLNWLFIKMPSSAFVFVFVCCILSLFRIIGCSISRFIQIYENRKGATAITQEQLELVRKKYPYKTVYLYSDDGYLVIKKNIECPLPSGAKLIRLGNKPLTRLENIKIILEGCADTEVPEGLEPHD